ncbi:hypothetical protein [Gulosibacter bifidus]|uniref:Lipoprotein n=1 Tax=Gulosibacter bifidus TaxID=272239 RepID=A0ABW5RFH6_9MICO|nr:hypothetical protein [Gulosibacter bifidus]
MRSRALISIAAATLLLTGCTGGESVPQKTGKPTSYDSLEALRDAFIAAGGECPSWEEIDPGDYDAQAGRCNDKVVIAIYNKPEELEHAIQRSKDLAVGTHLLVGNNWMINVENPQDFVDALGGRTVS